MSKLLSSTLVFKELDSIKNQDLGIDFSTLTTGSKKLVWWRCIENHSYDLYVSDRCKRNSVCPHCFKALSKERNILKWNILLFITYLFSTFFLLNIIKFSIYLPTLLSDKIRFFPHYENFYTDSKKIKSLVTLEIEEGKLSVISNIFGTKDFPAIIRVIGLGNSPLFISIFLMLLWGIIIYIFVDDMRSRKIWLNALILSLTVGGILVTIFSLRN